MVPCKTKTLISLKYVQYQVEKTKVDDKGHSNRDHTTYKRGRSERSNT